MASRVASRLSETAGGHGQPASHQKKHHSALSLIVVTPGHSTVLVQHHAVAAVPQRGFSPSPCAGPSTLGYGKVNEPTLGRPHTPAGADHEAEHHMPAKNLVHPPPYHKMSVRTDIPGCPDVSMARRRNADGPDVCQTAPHETSQGHSHAPVLYLYCPRVEM